MRKASINSFTTGMNTDSNVNKFPQSSFYDSENFRIVSDVALSNECLVSFKGTKGKIRMPSPEKVSIIGDCVIGNTLILLLKCKIDGSENDFEDQIVKVYLDSTNDILDYILVYSDIDSTTKLNFDADIPMRVVGNYEKESVQHVYWSNKNTILRSINIAADNLDKEASSFDIIPEFIQGDIQYSKIVDGGDLKAGKIQYAYRLFNKYGSLSAFSMPSTPLSLTKGNISSEDFVGADIDENINRSVIIEINNLSTDFDYIDVYSIFYDTINTIPTIRLISETDFSSDSITILDDGSNELDIVTVEEYNSIGGRLFSADTLETHDNILFAGNITEDFFDVDIDCRSYRFNSVNGNPQAIITDKRGSIAIQSDGDWEEFEPGGVEPINSGDDWEIPEDYDCAVYSNDVFATVPNMFANLDNPGPDEPWSLTYQKDGTTLGGSGRFIDYEFIELDKISLEYDGNKNGDEVSLMSLRTFKRGDVYRLSAVFFDDKSRRSFPKWIGDIRIPYEFNGTYFSSSEDDGATANFLGIKFTLKTSYMQYKDRSRIKGFQIYGVERKASDRSVLAQGFTHRAFRHDDDNTVRLLAKHNPEDTIPPSVFPSHPDFQLPGGLNRDDYLKYSMIVDSMMGFNSPEVSVNDININSVDDIKLKLVGYLHYDDNSNKSYIKPVSNTESIIYTSNVNFPMFGYEVNDDMYKIYSPIDFARVKNTTPTGPKLPITISNVAGDLVESKLLQRTWVQNFKNDEHNYSTESYFFSFPNTDTGRIPFRDFSGSFNTLIFDIIVNNNESRFGGNTYDARSRSVYMPFGEYAKIDLGEQSSDAIAFGDTYIGLYQQMTSCWDSTQVAGDTGGAQILNICPLESSVNTALMSMLPYKDIKTTYYSSLDHIGMYETKTLGITAFPDTYPDDVPESIYSYNSVYSNNCKYPTLVSKDLLFDPEDKITSLIISSDEKINGEIYDSWNVFKFNNKLELETKYGKLIRLMSFNGSLGAYQERAIANISVNYRSTITDGDGAKLALGTGGVLERYDYISTSVGIQEHDAVSHSDFDIYLIDKNKKALYALSNLTVPISKKYLINSRIKSLINESIVQNHKCHIGYDHEHDELLFTIGNTTIPFNEIKQRFYGTHKAAPIKYIQTPGFLMSYINTEPISDTILNKYIYRHNTGLIGEVYTEGRDESEATHNSVTIIINQDGNNVCEFQNLEYITEIYDGEVGFPDALPSVYETFTEIEYSNSYMTGRSDLVVTEDSSSEGNVSRINRVFKHTIPNKEGNRFSDSFIMIKLNYINEESKFIKVHDIVTFFADK